MAAPNGTRADVRDRGHAATDPRAIPRIGWRDIAVHAFQHQSADHLSMIAGGVAFYALLAIFPALTAAAALYALVADPAQIQQLISSLSGILPGQVQNLLSQQLSSAAQGAGGALTTSAIVGFLLALWASAKGTRAVLVMLGIAYEETDERGFLRFNAVALALTLGFIIAAVAAIALIAVLPAVLGALGLGTILEAAIAAIRWLLLAAGMVGALMVLYRLGPDRERAHWRWVAPGSIAATALWLIGSALFSVYVSHMGNYNAVYGALGTVIVLLLWLLITAFAIGVGAEINRAAEHQTHRDTTAD